MAGVTDFAGAQRINRRNTWLLLAALTLIAAAAGFVLGGFFDWPRFGALAFTVASIVWSAIALVSGDQVVLNAAKAREAPQLHNVIEEVALAAGRKAPHAFIVEAPEANALATGESIVVTRGLLERLNREELQGVAAHLLARIANGDAHYATVASATAGLVIRFMEWLAGRFTRVDAQRENSLVATIVWLIMSFVAVVLAAVAQAAAGAVQMAISRERDYLADATSVQFTRNPSSLVSALGKLDAKPVSGISNALAPLLVVDPRHPDVAARIARLRDLGA
jgi:heat shock protein HtpX